MKGRNLASFLIIVLKTWLFQTTALTVIHHNLSCLTIQPSFLLSHNGPSPENFHEDNIWKVVS
jgi:hypothetical protein